MKRLRHSYDNLHWVSNHGNKILYVSLSSVPNKEQLNTTASDNDGREAERLAELDHLNAITLVCELRHPLLRGDTADHLP